MHFPGFSIWNVVTPALIASLITLFYNSRAEKRKAVRDYVSKIFDSAREDVQRAVEAAVEYFPVSPRDRTALQEAKLWMGERDVRHSLSALISFSAEGGNSRSLLEEALDDFIDALTGGSFQAREGGPDVPQARAVAAKGGKLRAAIARARQRELESAITADLLSRNWTKVRAYMSQEMGVRRRQPTMPERPLPPEQ
jgi:hypothetical protein